MKNIGIITFHSAHNYGAMLQAYALQSKLNRAEIINYRNIDIDNGYKVIKRYKGKNIKRYIKTGFANIIFYRKNKKRFKKFNEFFNNKLKLSREYKSEEELKANPPKYDIYITGSDQVWNSDIANGLRDSYTLNFGNKETKRISYAASIGNSNIPKELENEYKQKISRIDYISVREESGKTALKNIGVEKDIKVVLDPTLLLTKEEWNKEIASNMPNENEKYILAYVVEPNEEYRKIVNYLSEKTGFKVIHFEKRNKLYKNVLRNAYTDGPFEFVNLIKNAEYVVATSFHATVFSIIYNKKFFIIPHLKTGTRVTNLLDKLEIKDRVYHNLKDFEKINYDFETDYRKVEELLNIEREKSIKFLKEAIEGE